MTRLFVAGSNRSIQEVVLEGTNWLSMKLVVSIGESTASCCVGNDVGLVAAVVLPAGWSLLALV